MEHEERPVAPSLGIDAVPVLAHALRARRQDVVTAGLLLALWVGFFVVAIANGMEGVSLGVVPGVPWPLLYGFVCLAHWGGHASAGRGAVYNLDKATLREAVKGKASIRVLKTVGPPVLLIIYWIMALVNIADDWSAVVFPLAMALPVWAHRHRVDEVMRQELGRQEFARRRRAVPGGRRQYRRIAAAIDREQYAGLTIYDPSRPFVGMGKPYEPWSFALELRRREGAPLGGPQLTGRAVVDMIRPRLEALRDSAAATSKDRLKDLEIEEFVYFPVGPHRSQVPYQEDFVVQNLRDAVDEGGEARRYFMRVRVGAWDEQVVVSVLVRVHTQGRMLVLEVVPHVLMPIRHDFRAVDAIAARRADPLRDGARALLGAPAAGFASAVSAIRTGVALFRTWLADPQRAVPDGPAGSVREMAGTQGVSLFQEMDISRYVKTVQDRIASGVRVALRQLDYETDQFEQKIVQIGEGGVYIGSMSGGAVAAGKGAQATQSVRGDGGRDG
ncbi:hypothetical protein ACFP1Z_27530 [Streptomyces gamaensis]|uniref:RDD family protein n=1 Tax=Streptomyces gamaensis TaxID=1763542 RepID=A0ABW0Z7V8_9ACTN